MPKSTGVRAAQRAATISRILAAAREEFARHGSAATLRSIARRAHVDPSLVLQYFTSKDALFIAATAVSEGGSEQHLRDVIAAKLDEPPPETMARLNLPATPEDSAETAAPGNDHRRPAETNHERLTPGHGRGRPHPHRGEVVPRSSDD